MRSEWLRPCQGKTSTSKACQERRRFPVCISRALTTRVDHTLWPNQKHSLMLYQGPNSHFGASVTAWSRTVRQVQCLCILSQIRHHTQVSPSAPQSTKSPTDPMYHLSKTFWISHPFASHLIAFLGCRRQLRHASELHMETSALLSGKHHKPRKP